MTPATVRAWVAEMKAERRATSQRECADLLGVSPRRLSGWATTDGVKGDAERRTGLAMDALLRGGKPYG